MTVIRPTRADGTVLIGRSVTSRRWRA